MFDAIELII